MTRHFTSVKVWAAGCVLASAAFGSVTFAQGPGGGPPPFGGRGGRGGHGGPGGPPHQATVANIPAAALTAELSLTADETQQISSIQQKFETQREALMPRPQDGQRPDPSTMRANFDKVQTLEQTAEKDIKAVLTDTQKQALPAALKEIETLHQAGIPAEILGDLQLTADEKQQIAAIVKAAQAAMKAKMDAAQQSGDPGSIRDAMDQSRRDTHDKAMAVLTDTQQSAVKQFMEAHPRPERGHGDGPPPPDGN